MRTRTKALIGIGIAAAIGGVALAGAESDPISLDTELA